MSEEVTQNEPTAEAVQENLMSLQDSMRNLDTAVLETQEVRRALLNKFLPEVLSLDMKVNAETDPDQYASQTRLIEQTRQLLNDIDNSAKNHVAAKLKQKDLDNQAEASINIAELLKEVKINQGWGNDNLCSPAFKSEELDDLLDEKCDEAGCVVLDTELEMGTNNLPKEEDQDDFEKQKE